MSYNTNVGFVFTGEVILPIVLTSVTAVFAYRYLVDKKIEAVGDYPQSPCIAAWSDWAERYYGLMRKESGPAVPNDFVDNDKLLLKDLSAASYGQCMPNAKWKDNKTKQVWLETIAAEMANPPAGPCTNKKPTTYMQHIPCPLYQTQWQWQKQYNPCMMGTKDTPLLLGDMSPVGNGGNYQNAVCVTTNVYANPNPNTGYPTFMGVGGQPSGVCQYTQDLLDHNKLLVTGSDKRPSDLSLWVSGTNPYAAYFHTNPDNTVTANGAGRLWWPWKGANTTAAPLGADPNMHDMEYGVVVGNKYGDKKSENGMGPFGKRNNPCFSRENCATKQCQVQLTGDGEDTSTWGPLESTPWNAKAVYTGFQSGPYVFGSNLGIKGTGTGVCN